MGMAFLGLLRDLPFFRSEPKEVIKNLIVASVGFDEFNATCRQRLLESLDVMDTELSWRTL